MKMCNVTKIKKSHQLVAEYEVSLHWKLWSQDQLKEIYKFKSYDLQYLSDNFSFFTIKVQYQSKK
jgi:hypothetical protein